MNSPFRPSAEPTSRGWLNLFKVLGLASLGLAIFLAIRDQQGVATAATVGLALVLVGCADRITKFSAFGVGAETREVAQQAKIVATEARALMVGIGKYLYWQRAASGRFGGAGQLAQQSADAILSETLRAAGLTPDDLREIATAEHPFTRFDYASYVTDAVSKTWTPEQTTAWNQFFGPERRKGIGTEPSPGDLSVFLVQQGFLSGETEERLKDYEHWDRNRTHRRPDAWLRWKNRG